MIVVDSSAWIELLRKTGSAVELALVRLLGERAPIAVTEIVVLELLAGARSDRQASELRSQLLGFAVLPLRGLAGYEAAAEVFRACRRAGDAIRGVNDCLVAVPAIAAGATLLHARRDFEALARHTPLELEPVRA